MDCIFCKIVSGEIPSKKVYEDELTYVFEDISPIAPIHYLIIPKEHITGASAINSENSSIVAKIFENIAAIAKEKNIEDGFRVITNCGEQAGQTVDHLHFHIIAGKQLGWRSDCAD